MLPAKIHVPAIVCMKRQPVLRDATIIHATLQLNSPAAAAAVAVCAICDIYILC